MLLLLAACSAPIPSEPEPSASDEPVSSASMLRDLGLPGSSRRAGGYLAGEYGWTGALGSKAGMHSVTEQDTAPGFRQVQLTFAVETDCFTAAPGAEPTAVTVAGFDGLYLEPYDAPGVQFAPQGGETTGAYALAIDDRTLCAYLTWDPATTPDELNAGREVLETIRAHAFGEDGIRINFTLPAGWDTG